MKCQLTYESHVAKGQVWLSSTAHRRLPGVPEQNPETPMKSLTLPRCRSFNTSKTQSNCRCIFYD